MGRVVHFESESHILIHHSILVYHFDLQGLVLLDFLADVDYFEEGLAGVDSKAILRIWKEDPNMLREALEHVGLYEVDVGVVRLHDAARYLPFFPSEHGVGDHRGVVPFELLFVLLLIQSPIFLHAPLLWLLSLD